MLIDVGLNATGVNVGLARITASINGWASRTAGSMASKFAAAFGATAIIAASREAIRYADNLDDLSKRLGVSTDALQEFGYAAKLNGAEMDDFTKALERLGVVRGEILSGSKAGESLLDAAGSFGLGKTDFQKLRSEEILKRMSRVMASGDPQSLIGPAKELLGRGAGNLMPALIGGLDNASEAAKRLGIVVDSRTIGSLATLADEMDIVAMELRGGFMPALKATIEGLFRVYYGLRAKLPFAQAASFFGALSAGSSIRGAWDIRGQMSEENAGFVDNMKAELEATMKRREEILQKFRDTQFPEGEGQEQKTRQGGENFGAFSIRTENQRVGAFINPIAFSIQKEQVTVLKKIESNTRRRPNATQEDIYAGT